MTGIYFKITCATNLLLNMYIFKTLLQFNQFLSQPIVVITNITYSDNNTTQDQNVSFILPSWFHPLVSNLLLLQLFYVQHSLLKNHLEKALQTYNVEYLVRSMYNLISAVLLQIMITCWSPVTSWALWDIPVESNSWTEWFIWTIRAFTWTMLIFQCCLLDISDLLGWEQIVHHINDLPPPSFFRSPDFNLALANMRHPGLLEALVLFWVTPTLTLDRLMCSGLLSAYVVVGFRGQCTHYVRRERERKLRELDTLSVACSPSKRVRFNLPEEE